MIEKADKIYEYRFKFIEEINKNIADIYKKITGLDGLTVKYENTLGLDSYDKEKIKETYLKKLKKHLNQEMMRGISLIGTHRDDFTFYLDNVDMKVYSSQGQQRMAIIAFKISELSYYKKIISQTFV